MTCQQCEQQRATIAQLLDAAEKALQLIIDNWIEDHGQRQVGEAWGALDAAIRAATGHAPKAAPITVDEWRGQWLRQASSVQPLAEPAAINKQPKCPGPNNG